MRPARSGGLRSREKWEMETVSQRVFKTMGRNRYQVQPESSRTACYNFHRWSRNLCLIELAPSILSADFARLADEVQLAAEGGATVLHVDIMDGHFVPNITVGPPVVASLRKSTNLPLDCHLMIENPDEYIPVFAEVGADWISVHQEACRHLHRTLELIRSHGT